MADLGGGQGQGDNRAGRRVSFQVRLHPKAAVEVDEAKRSYDGLVPGLGARFLDRVDATMQTLAAAPLRFPVWQRNRRFRKAIVRQFPYLVFFTMSGEFVDVLAVAHAARRPGSWRDRRQAGG